MQAPVIVVDKSRIRQERLDDLKKTVRELADFVEKNQSRPIAYNVYFNEDESEMTVIQVHPDSASMEHHMEVSAEAFRKFADLLELTIVEIYGMPSDRLLTMLQRKAEMLGGATVVVHNLQAGFMRLASEKVVG